MVEGLVLNNARALIRDIENERFSKVSIKHVCIDEIFTILDEMNFVHREDFDTNGWQVDYWTTFDKDGKAYQLEGSMWYGKMEFYRQPMEDGYE